MSVVTLKDVILHFVSVYHETRGQAPQPYYLRRPIAQFLSELDESAAERLSNQFNTEVAELIDERLLILHEGQWLELTDVSRALVANQKRTPPFPLVKKYVETAP